MQITDYSQNQSAVWDALTGLITKAAVLEAVAPHAKSNFVELFGSRDADRVASWCLRHYRKHGKPPGWKGLRVEYEKWLDGNTDRALAEVTSKLLNHLMERRDEEKQVEPLTSSHVIQIAQGVINNERWVKHREKVETLRAAGDHEAADELSAEYKPLDLVGGRATCASDIAITGVKWLWEGWLAFGEMAMFDGLPGQGKTLFTIDIAARVTRGWAMPPKPLGGEVVREPAGVVILSAEDSWEHTIGPRLVAAGADLTRIFKPDKEPIRFPWDIPPVARIITGHKARLLVIDPVYGFIADSKTDGNAEAHVRQFMNPLAAMVRQTGVASISTRHFKKEGSSAIHRGLGSQAWTAVCRLQHVIGKTDAEDADGPIVLACSKNNLAKRPESLAFYTEPTQVHAGDGRGRRHEIDTLKIAWAGAVDATADQVAGADRSRRGRPSKRDGVIEHIVAKLERNGGTMHAKEVIAQTMQELKTGKSGVMEAKNALKKLGLRVHKDGTFQGRWMWTLPAQNGSKGIEN
jgi:hypothetical protein